jgi:hypothetical protein
MIETLHRAAQYLAAGGNSFIEQRDDDSQSNLGWNSEFMALTTHPLNKAGSALSLNYPEFKLEWVEPRERIMADFELNGKSHAEVLAWIGESAPKAGLEKAYSFSLNYELPFSMKEDYRFIQPNPEEFVVFGNHRSNAQKALEELFEDQDSVSDIRVWPHHFDTGGLIEVEKDDSGKLMKSIGIGLSIPDGMVKDMYYYASAWDTNGTVEYSALPGLRQGLWITEGWNGIVLPATNVNEDKALKFFKEAVLVLQDMLVPNS